MSTVRNSLWAALGVVCIASASLAKGDSEVVPQVLRGGVETLSKGHWRENSHPGLTDWLRSTKDETAVVVPGAVLRMQAGASVRVQSAGRQQALKMSAKGGRVFVHLNGRQECQVASAGQTISASSGEFVLDADEPGRLIVVSGDAQIHSRPADLSVLRATVAASSSVEAATVALDGPDVRSRNKNKNRRRFTQGEQNKGRRIGEDVTPSPSPTYTPTPQASVQPTPTPSPTQPPTQPDPPPVVEEGFPWPVIGGLVGAGGIVALLVRRNDNNDVVLPSSP